MSFIIRGSTSGPVEKSGEVLIPRDLLLVLDRWFSLRLLSFPILDSREMSCDAKVAQFIGLPATHDPSLM